MVKGSNVEYLWSVHLLKKLREENMISDEEYAAIDRENRKSFYKNDNQRIAWIIATLIISCVYPITIKRKEQILLWVKAFRYWSQLRN